MCGSLRTDLWYVLGKHGSFYIYDLMIIYILGIKGERMTKGKVNQESYTEGIKNLIWVRDFKHIKRTLESEKDSSFEESMRIWKSGPSKED